jgi:hypothetical protein
MSRFFAAVLYLGIALLVFMAAVIVVVAGIGVVVAASPTALTGFLRG